VARPIVLIPHLFWLVGAIKFRNDYSPPLVVISTLHGRTSSHVSSPPMELGRPETAKEVQILRIAATRLPSRGSMAAASVPAQDGEEARVLQIRLRG